MCTAHCGTFRNKKSIMYINVHKNYCIEKFCYVGKCIICQAWSSILLLHDSILSMSIIEKSFGSKHSIYIQFKVCVCHNWILCYYYKDHGINNQRNYYHCQIFKPVEIGTMLLVRFITDTFTHLNYSNFSILYICICSWRKNFWWISPIIYM